jgi:RNA polymerase sigma factor (sigma-70 family)
MPGASQWGDGRAGGGIADVGELFADRAGQVRRLVRHEVRAPETVIDDACQVAWIRLVRHRDRVARETVVAWLVRTAMREAFKLLDREQLEVSLDLLLEDKSDLGEAVRGPSPDELVEHRARLDALRSLSGRQRQLVWLQGAGLTYAEMAEETGTTRRAVERQLKRARHQLTADECAQRASPDAGGAGGERLP